MLKKTILGISLLLINLNSILAATGIPKPELKLTPETKFALVALGIGLILIAIYWLLQQRLNRNL